MRDAGPSGGERRAERFFERGDLAGGFVDFDAALVDERQAGRVIAAVLEAFEPFEEERPVAPRCSQRYRTWGLKITRRTGRRAGGRAGGQARGLTPSDHPDRPALTYLPSQHPSSERLLQKRESGLEQALAHD